MKFFTRKRLTLNCHACKVIRMTKTQAKALATLIEMGGEDIDVTYPVKGVHTNAKWVLEDLGFIVVTRTARPNNSWPQMSATVTPAGYTAL